MIREGADSVNRVSGMPAARQWRTQAKSSAPVATGPEDCVPHRSNRACARRGVRSPLGLAARLGDRELFQLVAGLDIGPQPSRRRATTRPGLGAVFRIAVLRRDLAALELAAARLRTALGAAATQTKPFDR